MRYTPDFLCEPGRPSGPELVGGRGADVPTIYPQTPSQAGPADLFTSLSWIQSWNPDLNPNLST